MLIYPERVINPLINYQNTQTSGPVKYHYYDAVEPNESQQVRDDSEVGVCD
jgi:hypothetical protein